MSLSINKEFKDLITKQRAAAAVVEAGIHQAESLERQFKEDLKKRFKPFGEVHYLVCFRSGSATPNWQPHVLVENVTIGEKVHIKLEKEGWFVHPDPYINTSVLTKDEFGAPERDFADFEIFCKSLEEEFGIPVQLVEYKILDACKFLQSGRLPENSKEALIKHGGQILMSEKKWHKGWDIPDHFLILEDLEKKTHVYYSTDGHGGGYNTYVAPGDSLESFFIFLDGDYEKEMIKIFGV